MNSRISSWPGILAALLVVIFSSTAHSQQNNPLINSGDVLKKGLALHEEGKYKDAINTYRQVNRSDTNYADALYEITLSYYADSQFNAAIETAKKGLELFPDRYTQFTMQLANALDELNKETEALEAYNHALEKDPQSYILHFNKGVTYYRLEKEEEAALSFRQCLLINPFYASAHYFMGSIYLHKGNLVAAMLAYQTYLLVSPDGKYASRIVNLLSSIAKMNDDILKYTAAKKPAVEDRFDDVQSIIESKIALDKQYKLLIKLEDNIIRQLQVMNEKIEYNAGDKGFAMQYYVPFYTKVFKDGDFEPLMYSIFSELNIDAIKDWNKKNKAKREALISKASDYLADIRTTRTLHAADRASTLYIYWYEKGKYVGRGPVTDRSQYGLKGAWEFFYDNGTMKSKGSFDEKGEKTGEWTYYYKSGAVKEKINYLHNLQEGKSEGWFDNGNSWYTETYKEGKLEGEQRIYYYNGFIKQVTAFSGDKKDGYQKNYSSFELLSSSFMYKNDELEGTGISYYENGALLDEVSYKAGKADGVYKEYYESGKLKTKGAFTNSERQGLWEVYYESGAVKEKTTYLDNEITGEFTEYFENGKLSRKGSYVKKKLDGTLEDYDDDGKLYSTAVYDKGRLKEISFFDKEGKQLYNTGTRRGAAQIIFYNPDGIKTEEGYFNKDGNRDGVYTIYYPSGKPQTISNYKEGELDGHYTSFYPNGQKKFEADYTGGAEDGYSKSYYVHGGLSYEGWVINNQKQQNIIYYNSRGDITSKEFYLNNEMNGYSESFHPGNIKDAEYQYDEGWLTAITQFDSTGAVMAVNKFQKGEGPLIYKHYSGKNLAEGAYKHYNLNGPYRMYYFDGSVHGIYYYVNGKLDSTSVEYYYGGQKKLEGRYINGKRSGVWKSYFENGQLNDEQVYKDGELNGLSKVYNENGTLDKTISYKNGEIDGELRINSSKDELAAVLNFKNGILKSYTYEDAQGKLVPAITITGGTGLVKTKFKNGSPGVEIRYADNRMEGICNYYHSNGKLYVNGTREDNWSTGVKKIFYPSGQLEREENYWQGVQHGVQKAYAPDGRLVSEENYYNGDFHGKSVYYNSQGKPQKTLYYYYGTLLKVN